VMEGRVGLSVILFLLYDGRLLFLWLLFGSSDGVRLRDEVVLSLSKTYLLYLLCHLRPRYKLYNYLRYAQQCDQKAKFPGVCSSS
jgi:hypothetical protein